METSPYIICNPDNVTYSYQQALENTGLFLAAKWEKFGLLRGYEGIKNQKACTALATYYEQAALVMLESLPSSGLTSYGIFETVGFPMIRKAFMRDILTPENFGHVLNRMYALVCPYEGRMHDITGFPVHFDMEKHIVDTTMEIIAREFLTPEAYQIYLYER